jgi:hypothetical protein
MGAFRREAGRRPASPASGAAVRWVPDRPDCAECGFDWAVGVPAAIRIVERLPEQLGQLRWPPAQPVARTPAGWSVVGYLWHLVDVLRIGTERLVTLRFDPAAGLPCWDENTLAQLRQYERLSAVAGVRVLTVVVREWMAEAWDTPADAVARHPKFGDLTAADVIRRNAHEAVHHELDIRRLVPDGEPGRQRW